MVDGDLFDKLSRIGSIIHKKVEPFGGIQVLFLFTSFVRKFLNNSGHRYWRLLPTSPRHERRSAKVCIRGATMEGNYEAHVQFEDRVPAERSKCETQRK